MNKANSPAFQFYPREFLEDERIAVLANDELGAVMRLVIYDWLNDGLPDDWDRIVRLAVWPSERRSSLVKLLEPCLVSAGDGTDRSTFWFLGQRRKSQAEYRALQATKGKLGGRPRKEGGGRRSAKSREKPRLFEPELASGLGDDPAPSTGVIAGRESSPISVLHPPVLHSENSEFNVVTHPVVSNGATVEFGRVPLANAPCPDRNWDYKVVRDMPGDVEVEARGSGNRYWSDGVTWERIPSPQSKPRRELPPQ